MASIPKRKRDVPLSPLIEKAVKQARSAQPAKEGSSRVVVHGTMVDSPPYLRLAPTPSKSASPVKGAEGDESEDELLIEQASRRRITRPSPHRPTTARSQPVASTSEIHYTPRRIKRKLESEEHQAQVAPHIEGPTSTDKEPSKGKSRALPRVKQEADGDEIVVNVKDALPRKSAESRPSPSSARQPRTNVTVEIPVKRQSTTSINRKKASQIPVAPTPVSIKRPKVEEPDEDVIFVPKAGPAPIPAVREGIGELPPVPEQRQLGAVAHFLTHQCDPPIPQERLQNMVDLFKKLGISTEFELKAIAKPGNVQDFWMGVARKEGLSTLWEAVIRDGLGKLV